MVVLYGNLSGCNRKPISSKRPVEQIRVHRNLNEKKILRNSVKSIGIAILHFDAK